MGENASEMINKLSRQLEHAREVADIFIEYVGIENVDISDDLKKLLENKISKYLDDKEE